MMIHGCSATMFPVKSSLCGQGDDRQADGGCRGRGQVLRSCDPRVLREARRKFARGMEEGFSRRKSLLKILL